MSNPQTAAPTILGWHHGTTCPRCQGTLILPAPEPSVPHQMPFDPERPGICLTCYKTSVAAKVEPNVHGPDWILASKLCKPERWDVIVFRYPKEPAQRYIKRLVGLPGEKVYVKGESVWIDDVKMDVPASPGWKHRTLDFPLIRKRRTPCTRRMSISCWGFWGLDICWAFNIEGVNARILAYRGGQSAVIDNFARSFGRKLLACGHL